jgi:hypothetical protein
MANQVFPGISAFFAGIHCKPQFSWLQSDKRPYLSVNFSDFSGGHTYDNLFLSSEAKTVTTGDASKKVTIPANSTCIIHANDIKRPLFSIQHKANA